MASSSPKTLGFIVNPVAGLGGKVGLKGSDGLAIQQRAREMGAVPAAGSRAAEALHVLKRSGLGDIRLITYPAEMGETVALSCGFTPTVIGDIRQGKTRGADTQSAARDMLELGSDLILFAGGDGTAQDIFEAIGMEIPVIGIPAGVKIHSAVFGINPSCSGTITSQFLLGEITTLREAEVMDIDEDAYRQGLISPHLLGYLRIPYQKQLVQARKSPNPVTEESLLRGIALDVVESMEAVYYVIGPGTTNRAIMMALDLKKTLIGVDVVKGGELVLPDANEKTLLDLLENQTAKIILTPVGGQGYILGRGNQQISPEVLRMVGLDNIVVISPLGKILALGGKPLLVDTGDPDIDNALSGYTKIITGFRERIVYPITGGPGT